MTSDPAFRNPVEHFKRIIKESVVSQFPDLEGEDFKFENPPSFDYGHLALACFPFARKFRKKPDLISAEISEKITLPSELSSMKAIGPYINFFFSAPFVAETLFQAISADGVFGKPDFGKGKTILIEFSSPNTNKPLHLGHGRNNMLGVALSNIFQACNYSVKRVNLVNDRGIHICKSMLAYEMFGEGSTPESEGRKGDHFVGDYYVKFDKAAKENPELEEQAGQMLVDWENGDSRVVDLWKKMNTWVLEGFEETYQRMGVAFDKYYFESDMYTHGRDIILKALEEGRCVKEENGGITIDLEDVKLGKKALLRGDGTSVYITQDIYTTVKKNEDFHPDHLLFVVGNEQDYHFKVLFEVLKRFGYNWAEKCEHISYGMITLPEGKMKSREGTVVDLDNLFDEVRELALAELKKRELERLDRRSDEQLLETAEHIAQAAVKFVLLKTGASRNIMFDSKESISFDGMTGPYLLYTHARICSLISKAEMSGLHEVGGDYPWTKEEGDFMAFLCQFPDHMTQAANQRNPAILANFIYEAARLYNKYYFNNPIAKAPDRSTAQARLNLSFAFRYVLAECLVIFGITPIERM